MEGGLRYLGQALIDARRWLLDAFFPEHCFGCGVEGRVACADCLVAISPVPECRTLAAGTTVAALYPYGNPLVRRLITGYKFSARTGLASVFELLLRRGGQTAPTIFPVVPTIICPIPLSPRRERERGFNQATALAELLAPLFPPGSRVEHLLRRTRRTAQQSALPKTERAGNVAGCFAAIVVAPGGVSAAPVLLVDDVVTSGETIGAAARALGAAGWRDVSGFAFAHAPMNSDD